MPFMSLPLGKRQSKQIPCPGGVIYEAILLLRRRPGRKTIPVSALISLRQRLELLPPRYPDGKTMLSPLPDFMISRARPSASFSRE